MESPSPEQNDRRQFYRVPIAHEDRVEGYRLSDHPSANRSGSPAESEPITLLNLSAGGMLFEHEVAADSPEFQLGDDLAVMLKRGQDSVTLRGEIRRTTKVAPLTYHTAIRFLFQRGDPADQKAQRLIEILTAEFQREKLKRRARYMGP